MTEKSISVEPPAQVTEITPKPSPRFQSHADLKSVTASYASAKDGSDSNLLIFFHGLGDTQAPFFRLGASLNLPQTAVLSVRGFKRIPLLEEDAFAYWDSFDQFGEVITQPNPSAALKTCADLINYLIETCKWPASALHLFGFGQGGSLAAEVALRYPLPLGSCVLVNGPLLSLPTLSKKSPTPVLSCRRSNENVKKAWLEKGFESVQELVWPSQGNMPANRSEWEPIMRFWSAKLRKLQPWEFAGSDQTGSVYKVVAS